ncbi:MAG: DUF2945 domain-containing protein [Spirosoma sp.]|nr:DUF2945 domain-containing protein [Spirosoma sp.]
MTAIKKGDDVTWRWGKGEAEGTVSEVHTDDVERETQGSTTKRKGSKDESALVITQGKKTIVKLASEVDKK